MPTQKEWKELEKGFLGIFALYDKMYKAHLTAMGEKAPPPDCTKCLWHEKEKCLYNNECHYWPNEQK